MITVSAAAASERMREFVNRLERIEWTALWLAIGFAAAAAFAVHADSTGRKWPTVVTSLIAAGLVVSLLGAGFGWVFIGHATALARRIDIASAMASQGITQARVIRASQEDMHHMLRVLMENDRAMIVELGRLRAVERDRLEEMVHQRAMILKAINDARWQGYAAGAQDVSGGGDVTPFRR